MTTDIFPHIMTVAILWMKCVFSKRIRKKNGFARMSVVKSESPESTALAAIDIPCPFFHLAYVFLTTIAYKNRY